MTNSVRHFKLRGYCRYLFYIMCLLGVDISKYQVRVAKSIRIGDNIDFVQPHQGHPHFSDFVDDYSFATWWRLPSQPFDKNACVFYAQSLYEDKYFLMIFSIDYPREFLTIEIWRYRKCGNLAADRERYGLQRT